MYSQRKGGVVLCILSVTSQQTSHIFVVLINLLMRTQSSTCLDRCFGALDKVLGSQICEEGVCGKNLIGTFHEDGCPADNIDQCVCNNATILCINSIEKQVQYFSDLLSDIYCRGTISVELVYVLMDSATLVDGAEFHFTPVISLGHVQSKLFCQFMNLEFLVHDILYIMLLL